MAEVQDLHSENRRRAQARISVWRNFKAAVLQRSTSAHADSHWCAVSGQMRTGAGARQSADAAKVFDIDARFVLRAATPKEDEYPDDRRKAGSTNPSAERRGNLQRRPGARETRAGNVPGRIFEERLTMKISLRTFAFTTVLALAAACPAVRAQADYSYQITVPFTFGLRQCALQRRPAPDTPHFSAHDGPDRGPRHNTCADLFRLSSPACEDGARDVSENRQPLHSGRDPHRGEQGLLHLPDKFAGRARPRRSSTCLPAQSRQA